MARTFNAVKQQRIGIRIVSEMHQIPISTLHDHITRKVEHGPLPGQRAYLSIEKEEEIVSFFETFYENTYFIK